MQGFDVEIAENLYIGMNNKYPSHLLPNGVFTSIENAFIDNNKIFKRGGTTQVAASLGAFLPLGGTAFEPTGGSKFQVVCLNGTSNARLWTSTGGAFSSIGTANLTNNAYMNFTQASNKLFGFNGVEEVDLASDGTTVTRNRSGVPKGTYAFWFHNYLFVAGVSGNPDRLYFSNLGDPTSFGGSDYVDINANDGDSINGLNILNDELIVFKKYSIWAISGWSGTTFAVTTAAGQNTTNKALGVGTISHQSIVPTGRDLYYLSFLGAIPHFRSLNQTVFAKTVESGIVSDEIEGTMTGLNFTALTRCSGIFDGKYIYWTIADGSSATNDLVIVTTIGRSYKTSIGSMDSWVTFTGITAGTFFSSTISGRSKIYFIDATTRGKVFLFNDTSTYSDDGTPVVMDIFTRDYMADPSRQTNYLYLYHKYLSGSAGTLKVYARINQAQDFSLEDTINLLGSSPGLGPTGNFTLGVSLLGGATITQVRTTLQQLTGSLLGLEFKESTANYCEIYDHQVFGFKKGYRSS